MKLITNKDILISVLISYLIVSHINNTFNTFWFSQAAKVLQIWFIAIFLFSIVIYKQLNE